MCRPEPAMALALSSRRSECLGGQATTLSWAAHVWSQLISHVRALLTTGLGLYISGHTHEICQPSDVSARR